MEYKHKTEEIELLFETLLAFGICLYDSDGCVRSLISVVDEMSKLAEPERQIIFEQMAEALNSVSRLKD